jgi:hypothetical protein
LLDSVIAAYLETLSEVEFFDAFAAILRANGFYDIHRTHGTGEFGRDFIAKRLEDGVIYQYGIQTKVGNIGLNGWREVRNQIEDIRLMTNVNPNFDQDLPRKGVLATTGRLVGQAPTGADNYRQQFAAELTFEVWPIEHLIEMMVDAPESGLAGELEVPLIGAVAAIHLGTLRERQLDELSLSWIGHGVADLPRSALAALVIAERLARSDRRDLACLVGPHLVRSTWATVHGAEPPPPEVLATADLGKAILVRHARALLEEYAAVPEGSTAFLGATIDAGAMLTYPVRCLRLLELFGLAGLAEQGEVRTEFSDACERIVRELPGASHPPSDNWAVAIVPGAILLSERDPDLVGRWLRQLCVWLADHYERGKVGLARPLAPPDEEVRHLLCGPLDFIEVARRSESFLASVLLDLASALELGATYDDIFNDVTAVDAYPQVVECDDDMTQYRDEYPGVYLELWRRYDESTDAQRGWACAPHHRRWQPHYLDRIQRYWDSLALSAVLRDRCMPGVIREMAGLSVDDSGTETA